MLPFTHRGKAFLKLSVRKKLDLDAGTCIDAYSAQISGPENLCILLCLDAASLVRRPQKVLEF
jgi:hypothetical protein